jgi:hypothetical protein
VVIDWCKPGTGGRIGGSLVYRKDKPWRQTAGYNSGAGARVTQVRRSG